MILILYGIMSIFLFTLLLKTNFYLYFIYINLSKINPNDSSKPLAIVKKIVLACAEIISLSLSNLLIAIIIALMAKGNDIRNIKR